MRWVLDETIPWFDADWTRAELGRRREELAEDPSDQQLVDYIARLEADLAMIESVLAQHRVLNHHRHFKRHSPVSS